MTRTERREQLIEVAQGLFAERGLEGTSVEEIAAHAGSISYELLCAVSQRVPLALM